MKESKTENTWVQAQPGRRQIGFQVPRDTDVRGLPTTAAAAEPAALVEQALEQSIGSPGLAAIAQDTLAANPAAQAVIVVSDYTRPVPYRGDGGILWPVIACLLESGFTTDQLLILVATGTHRAMTEAELKEMLDHRVWAAGIRVKNHAAQDAEGLGYLGTTKRGSEVYVNKAYLKADLKILTGLVESHFMAGASGGRKAVCPGLIGEQSTYVFHGPDMLSDANARDLVLTGNPCHEEASEVAELAGADYIVNVTLDHEFRITGVFAGDLHQAHAAAVDRLVEQVGIPVQHRYDIVISHGGYVGVNHYQMAKAAVVAASLVNPGGALVLLGDHRDQDPVGSPNYRTVLHLLTVMGAASFERLIRSDEWAFIPEQWQVQMWSRVLRRIPASSLVYVSPQYTAQDEVILPGTPGHRFLPAKIQAALDSSQEVADEEWAGLVMTHAVGALVRRFQEKGKAAPQCCFLKDGPYGIPLVDQIEDANS